MYNIYSRWSKWEPVVASLDVLFCTDWRWDDGSGGGVGGEDDDDDDDGGDEGGGMV